VQREGLEIDMLTRKHKAAIGTYEASKKLQKQNKKNSQIHKFRNFNCNYALIWIARSLEINGITDNKKGYLFYRRLSGNSKIFGRQ